MTQRIFLKPTPLVIDGQTLERRVRKPIGTVMAAEGEFVNLDSYWRRRVVDGEVEEATPSAGALAAEAPSATPAAVPAESSAAGTPATDAGRASKTKQ